MTVLERFLRYIKVDTQSDPHTGLNPSTPGQMDFALMLCEELRRIGLQDAEVDGNGYVMASLPSNAEREVPVVGFIAHIDTSPELSGRNVNPQIIEHYMGNDIVLNKERDLVLAVDDFPELKHYVGQTLVTTDGNTLLGADGKAGVAEIMADSLLFLKVPSFPELPDIAFVSDTMYIRDTVYVPVRWVQHKYERPDYQAWVSGYQIGSRGPQLDSIWLYPETRYVTRTVRPAERKNSIALESSASWCGTWSLTVSAEYEHSWRWCYVGTGVGYDVVTRSPYIAVRAGVPILSW